MMSATSSKPPLRKEDVEAGFVLWLPRDAPSRDRNTYLRSRLDELACNHPVLVIDTLDPSHDLVWVLIVSDLFDTVFFL